MGDADRTDDLAALCQAYQGQQLPASAAPAREITVKAVVSSIPTVTAFVEEALEAVEASMKAVMQISVAIDEAFSNISYYAYPSGTGDATVRFCFDMDQRVAVISFLDHGIPYNPMEKQDPDVSLPAEQRQIGGLGIFMIKKTMDYVAYRREGETNILTVCKRV